MAFFGLGTQPLRNVKDIVKQQKGLTPEQIMQMNLSGVGVGFDQPQGPQSFFPSLNATEGPNKNKSVTTGPAQGGFDLGGMLGGIGNAFKDPALIAGVVGTGLGLASGQLSPIQSLGAGAQGAQGILNQQREDELALRNKQWQMQLAMASGNPSAMSIADTIALGKAVGLDKITDPLEKQKALNLIRQGKAFNVQKQGGFFGLGGKQVVTGQ